MLQPTAHQESGEIALLCFDGADFLLQLVRCGVACPHHRCVLTTVLLLRDTRKAIGIKTYQNHFYVHVYGAR